MENSALNFEEQIPGRGFAWLIIGLGFLLLTAEIVAALSFKIFMGLDSLSWAAFGFGGGLLNVHRILRKKAFVKYPEKYFSAEVLDKLLPSVRKCILFFILALISFLVFYLSKNFSFLTLAEILLGVGLSWLFLRNKFNTFKQENLFNTAKEKNI